MEKVLPALIIGAVFIVMGWLAWGSIMHPGARVLPAATTTASSSLGE